MADLVRSKVEDMELMPFDAEAFPEGSDTKDTALATRSGEKAGAVRTAAGQCTNNTGEAILVYGPKHPSDTSRFETSLYRLRPGITTPNGWDCDGFFVPNDRIASQAATNVQGPCAIKYFSVFSWTVTKNGNNYNCPLNQGLFKPSEVCCPSNYPTCVCWRIPNLPQSSIG
jgi:hypothetical protein